MRVLLSIDTNWIVSCSLAGVPDRRLSKVADGKGVEVPLLDLKQHAGEPTGPLTAGAKADAITAVYDRLMKRAIQAGDPDIFGAYLFDCLLGSNWAQIQAAAAAATPPEWFIELAIASVPADTALARLPWELMRSPDAYLSSGYVRGTRQVDVAITRVVPNTMQTPRAIEGLPRVLFAVGTLLNDESVRPAAEILCTLKRARAEQRRMHPRILERASPSKLKKGVAAFKPDVVHLLCHGGIQGGVPFLQLQSETGGKEESFTAQQIATALQGDGNPPPIVLLSACQSGTAMMSPQGVGPLAAELVAAGIPIVIGMTGKVTDVACRLFSRRFAETLLGGERLIQATAEGRRAAFAEGKPPQGSIDWAFPAVFLSSGVDPNYRPTDPDSPPDAIEDRIRAYTPRTTPTFCGRQDFFQAFETLFSPNEPSVLAVHTATATIGYGRKRLLEELAVQALLEGHVPVLVTSRTWRDEQQPPNTPLKLALEIDRAVDVASKAFDVKLTPLSPAKRLQQLVESNFDPALVARLDEQMQAALIGVREVPADAALLAIEGRLTELITQIIATRETALATATAAAQADATKQSAVLRAAAELASAQRARVVVLLDSIQMYDTALKALQAPSAIGPFGLGTKAHPAPVVVTFSLGATATTILDPMVQSPWNYPNWRILELKPFDPSGEHLLACSRVLLNPFDNKLFPNVSDKAWVFDDTVDENIRADTVSLFNQYFHGLPNQFSQSDFFWLALLAVRSKGLIEAKDDQILAAEFEKRRNLGVGP